MSSRSNDPNDATLNSDYSSPVLRELELIIRKNGFEHFGFALLSTPFSIEVYEEWLKQGFQGEMEYLERHLEEKREPVRLSQRAKAAIVITENYVPHPSKIEEWPLKGGARVAAYAQGKDYHRFLNNKLKALASELQRHFVSEEFLVFTDSSPVLERDLANRAGLGWVGKNTCLIDRDLGSMFLIGEIYTSLDLPVAAYDPKELARDFCGTCTRCLDACPTQALIAPKQLDARKCISYLTIETPKIAAEPLRSQIGDWLFGCDICQTVCPWNVKALGRDKLQRLEPPDDEDDSLKQDLRYILTSSNRKLERVFRTTPLARINGLGLKRNALVVAGNRRLKDLSTEVEALREHPRLGELAKWTLRQMNSSTTESS